MPRSADQTIPWQRAWTLHLLSFVLPVATLFYLLNGPYTWWMALLWPLPVSALVYVDIRSPADKRRPPARTPDWAFDLQVYALAALQLANHVLLGVMVSRIEVTSFWDAGTVLANLWAMMWMSGVTAGYTGIVVAHELIHRRNRLQFLLGRVLLMFVWYEHFATEHVRGHHPRLGTPKDAATARFDETFRQFFKRTVPAQFKSAWELESKRLGDPNLPRFDRRMLRHRVLQGVCAQVAITIAYWQLFGPLAVLFFLAQARVAFTLLEVVNYIEHWGIIRATRAVTHVDSWDTSSWFTLHTLVGLSRHADHHAQASRPFHKLRYFRETPKMPTGYYGSVVLAMFQNERYRALARAELKRRQLGPYASTDGTAALAGG